MNQLINKPNTYQAYTGLSGTINRRSLHIPEIGVPAAVQSYHITNIGPLASAGNAVIIGDLANGTTITVPYNNGQNNMGIVTPFFGHHVYDTSMQLLIDLINAQEKETYTLDILHYLFGEKIPVKYLKILMDDMTAVMMAKDSMSIKFTLNSASYQTNQGITISNGSGFISASGYTFTVNNTNPYVLSAGGTLTTSGQGIITHTAQNTIRRQSQRSG